MIICGIDPGPETSGICVWDTDRQTICAHNAICENNLIVDTAEYGDGVAERKIDKFVIEDIACFGVSVGKSVFDTLKVIGRLQERLDYQMVFKNDIQLHFCNTKKAKDANIKRVLLDRFGEKGTKKNPGITYNLKNHSWDAFALCIYYQDIKEV